jgi:adenosylhomocysteine nucleosidase
VTDPTQHLGVLAGLQSEARWLSPIGERRSVALSAARQAIAETASARLIVDGATHLLSFGLAGGLDPALPAGTLLLPDVLVLPDGTERPVDAGWHAGLLDRLSDLQPVAGRHLGADLAVADAGAKAALFARTRSLAVDMESHILARAASGRPFAILRVVCDAAEDVLPPAALAGVKPDGATDIIGVLGSILRHPGQIPALGRLARAAKAADRVLKACGSRPLLPG